MVGMVASLEAVQLTWRVLVEGVPAVRSRRKGRAGGVYLQAFPLSPTIVLAASLGLGGSNVLTHTTVFRTTSVVRRCTKVARGLGRAGGC